MGKKIRKISLKWKLTRENWSYEKLTVDNLRETNGEGNHNRTSLRFLGGEIANDA
jgi:hypothetical protein